MQTDGITDRTRSLFQSLRIPASGLSAQRARIDAIAQNIANAETTSTGDGTPYRRKVIQLAESRFEGALTAQRARFGAEEGGADDPTRTLDGVRVVGIAEDSGEGNLVYEPGHPDADEAGYVRYPNVAMSQELVDLMDARRSYEANVSVFEAVKAMLRRAAQI